MWNMSVETEEVEYKDFFRIQIHEWENEFMTKAESRKEKTMKDW